MSRSIVIQAGGQSSRMGQDKARMMFCGEPLIHRVVGRLTPLSGDLWVILAAGSDLVLNNIKVAVDEVEKGGPLVGFKTGLNCTIGDYVGIAACDMPFVSAELFDGMFSEAESGGWDAVIPAVAGRLEPLHAVYRRQTCLPEIEKALANGEKRLVSFLGELKACQFTEERVQVYGDPTQIFMNVNTLDDIRRAEAQACGG